MKAKSTNLQRLLNDQQHHGLTPEILRHLPLPVDCKGGRAGVPLARYIMSTPLLKAIHVALLLRQPLLITGEPGVGKTACADELARRLGLGAAIRAHVKSTINGRDLLYSFDDVRRFRDAALLNHSPGYTDFVNAPTPWQGLRTNSRPLVSYVQLNALGLAIVRAAGRDAVVEANLAKHAVVGGEPAERTPMTLGELFPAAFHDLPIDVKAGHSVVLIDEIDKAPRDAPNDLLDEVEQMRFRIEELDIGEISAKPEYWPIVILTSNSERNLPEAFLRRCIFHHLALPKDDLPEIIVSRLNEPEIHSASAFIQGLVEIFHSIRAIRDLEKVPSTGELIAAAFLLRNLDFPAEREPWKHNDWSEVIDQLAGTLAKKRNDREKVLEILTEKFESRS